MLSISLEKISLFCFISESSFNIFHTNDELEKKIKKSKKLRRFSQTFELWLFVYVTNIQKVIAEVMLVISSDSMNFAYFHHLISIFTKK